LVELAQPRLQRGQLRLREGADLRIRVLDELLVLLDVADELLALPPANDRIFEPGTLAPERGELTPVRDDGGIAAEPPELFVAPPDLLPALPDARLRRETGG